MMIRKITQYKILVFGYLIFLSLASFAQAENLPKTLLAPNAHMMQQAGDLEIFDIRTPEEWTQTGVAEGANLITMHNPDGPLAFLAAIKLSVKGDLDKPIAMICATGARSDWAQKFLKANGFSNVSNISEGMMGRGPTPGWIARKLPTKQP